MTFRLRHEWTEGALLPGAALATCSYCETLRVTEGSGVTFIRRKLLDEERVSAVEPPCVAPSFFRAPDEIPAVRAVVASPRGPAVCTPPTSADPQGPLW